MEARSSILGDFRTNHPRRWNLPTRNWPDSNTPRQAIELSNVHIIVQLRTESESNITDVTDLNHPLHHKIKSLSQTSTGLDAPDTRILSVQAMQRYSKANTKPTEHFGFKDLESQPYIEPDINGDGVAINENYSNQVHLGELLLGYENEADPKPVWPQFGEKQSSECATLFNNGTFFVIRKLKQNVGALNSAVTEASAATALPESLILAKMMGCQQDGTSLIQPGAGGPNDFNFFNDKEGKACPFHSHVRRANPREILKSDFVSPELAKYEFKGRRAPHLMRRSMPYGPLYDKTQPDLANSQDRGLIFMAYNASLAEQFEVIQRWISGGNSSGGFSRHSDPFLGVPDNHQKRTYRFEHDNKSYSIELDGAVQWNADRKPLVQLEWGLYSFVPSIRAIGWLAANASTVGVRPGVQWSAEDGLKSIKALKELEMSQGESHAVSAWKVLLEEPESQEKYISASVWAAIRKYYGGSLRTPYGVLVADKRFVMDVMRDPKQRYSVSGYHRRMEASIGPNYLGLDRPGDGSYDKESHLVNEAIGKMSENEAYELTFKLTNLALYKKLTFADLGAIQNGDLSALADLGFISFEKYMAKAQNIRWELNIDVKEISDRVLALLCQHWFGLPTTKDNERDIHPQKVKDAGIVAGSWRWDWTDDESPIYPSQFTAPSRFIFQPRPNEDVASFGCRYGVALTAGLEKFLKPYRANHTIPTTPEGKEAVLAKAILDALPDQAQDLQVARTFVGALMGFLPTVDGNLRLSLNEWLRDGTFWSIRAKWQADPSPNDIDKAKRLLGQALSEAMQLRPSPELVWRTSTQAHSLGEVDINAGDVIVVSIVSATQQCLEEHKNDLYPIFGGNRKEVSAPTHACPGYSAAMGVLLGFISALVSVKEKMRPSPAPLAFTVSEQ